MISSVEHQKDMYDNDDVDDDNDEGDDDNYYFNQNDFDDNQNDDDKYEDGYHYLNNK